MIHSQALTVGATLGVAGFQLLQSAESGATASAIGGQLTVIGSGVAVFLYQERRRQREQKAAAAARRASDKQKDARISYLESELARLNGALIDEVRHHPPEG